MDGFDRLRSRVGRAASGLRARTVSLAGAGVLVASVAAFGAIRTALAPEPPLPEPSAEPPAWTAATARAALAEGRLVLAQLEPQPEAATETAPAPTLAEVVDLPIRRVATTRIVLGPEEEVAPSPGEGAAPAAEPIARSEPAAAPSPAPDLDALLAQEPSALYPAPEATVPVRYASLPEASAPGRFDLHPPPLPLLARLPAPPPPIETSAPPAPDATAENATSALARAAPDPAAEPVATQPSSDEAVVAALTLPPPRPASLPAPQPRPAPEPAAPPPASQEQATPARERTLGSLLRAVLGVGGMPGVTEAADGKTPTVCVPEPLREILVDVARAFGEVTLVSTQTLNTGNHYLGSARHRFHQDCEAVDFRVEGDPREVVRWLRGRPNVGGVASYRNGVIHVDLDRAVAARLRR